MKTKGSISPGDDAVVMAFVDHLRANGHPGLVIESWPERQNRSTRDIEAIAGPFAIEHTSIDTIPGQRRDNARFVICIESLVDDFKGAFPFRLRVTVPYDVTTPGRDLPAVKEAMRTWLRTEPAALPEGHHTINSAGTPFTFQVWKRSAGRPGLLFLRFDPNDKTLAARARTLLDRKAAKLRPYQEAGKTTVLLVESEDIALMHVGKLLHAISSAYGRLPDGVDQLWYVDTSIATDIEFTDLTEELWHAQSG
jgi:hypothetical protein